MRLDSSRQTTVLSPFNATEALERPYHDNAELPAPSATAAAMIGFVDVAETTKGNAQLDVRSGSAANARV